MASCLGEGPKTWSWTGPLFQLLPWSLSPLQCFLLSMILAAEWSHNVVSVWTRVVESHGNAPFPQHIFFLLLLSRLPPLTLSPHSQTVVSNTLSSKGPSISQNCRVVFWILLGLETHTHVHVHTRVRIGTYSNLHLGFCSRVLRVIIGSRFMHRNGS